MLELPSRFAFERMVANSSAPFFKQLEHPLLCRDERIGPRRLTVEVVSDRSLDGERWSWDSQRSNVAHGHILLRALG